MVDQNNILVEMAALSMEGKEDDGLVFSDDVIAYDLIDFLFV